MDYALAYDTQAGLLDMSLAGSDLAGDDTLKTAVLLSLTTDRQAQDHEVATGEDRKGWWADAYASTEGDLFGSRLWLLARTKQLQSTQVRARDYAREALQWLVDDGLASSVEVTAMTPRIGWLVLDISIGLNGSRRRYRFEWSDAAPGWRLADEAWVAR